jgi:D-3-phosphoglycerate dehydrogenase
MTICYIDCSPYMRDLMRDAGLTLPDALRLHIGDPERDALPDLIGDAEIVLNGHSYMDATTIAALRRVRRIIFLGTGATSYIDVVAAAERGIAVETIRGYGDRSVAEHAFALMMAGARQIAMMDRRMRADIWEPIGGVELGGRTLGIIGAGGIGLELAAMASGFGMKVLIWNRSTVAGGLAGFSGPDRTAADGGGRRVAASRPDAGHRAVPRQHAPAPDEAGRDPDQHGARGPG